MDTQSAVSILTALSTTIKGQVTGFQGQADALDIAVQIINGTLATQAAALEAKYQATIDGLNGQVTDLTATVSNLATQVATLNTAPASDTGPTQTGQDTQVTQ